MTSAPSFAQGRYIVVESTDFSESPWDNQFWVFFPDYTREAGDEWEWSMEVKADKEATINTQINVLPGHYLSSGGFGREFPFTTEWETVNGVYECNDADEGGQSVAFYLSTLSEANKYYFRNISVKVNGKEVVRNGDLSNDDFSSFYWWRSLDGGLDGVYPDPDLITTDMVYGTTVKVDPIPYAIFDESTGTLTFYYNNNKPDGAYGIRTDYDNEWSDVKDKITKVIFNASFADYRPTSCAAWFAGLSNLTEIIGMEYLNTEKVTDMSSMFSGCKKLTSLDISNFSMTKVTNTNSMFAQCTNLQTIYVGDVWTTNNVTKSESMFYDCTSLIGGEGTTYDANYTDATYARIDVPANDALGYFTNINGSPNRCIVVESTGNFDGYVTPWNDIFWVYFPDYTVSAGDVWEWSIEVKADKNATIGTYMHSSLGQFHSDGGFGPVSFSKVWETVNGVHECVAADEGGQSVAFYLNTLSEANKYYFRNISVKVNGVEVVRNGDLSSDDFSSFYWKTDGREPELVTTDNLYWTYVVDEPVPYGTFNKFTGTVTLGYGTTLPNNAVQFEPDHSSDGISIVQEILSSLGYTDNVDVTKIVISPSFANFNPTATAFWFYNLRGLTKIDGLQYLNTEDVESMVFMFGNCESLSSLNLSSFNTAKTENMFGMFQGCCSLSTLDLSSFNTAKTKSMGMMFSGCSSLSTLDLSSFNTENVWDYVVMMFYNCENLQTIYASYDWVPFLYQTDNNFGGCERLVGGAGSWIGNIPWGTDYAKIDGGVDNPGAFTKSPKETRTPVSIEIKTPPTQLVYAKDEPLHIDYDAQLTVTFDDGSEIHPWLATVNVTGYDPTQVGEQTLTAEYLGLSTTFNVTVIDNGVIIDDENPSEIVADLYDNTLTTVVEAETEVDKVVVHREFDEDTPSTIVMPIDMEVGEDMNGYKFYEFGGVTRNSEGKWVATYNQVDHISANKPYIVQNTSSSDDALVFDGGSDQITLKPLAEGETAVSTGTGDNEGWEFVGTYEKKVWETDSPNEFGFAAKDVEADGIKAGDFVRIGAGASLKPMRSYLRYTKDDDPFISKAGKVLPHEIEVHLIPLASVVKPEEPEEPEDGGDIKTPISENVVDDGGVRVWSYDKTIVIAAKPGAEYQIFDANGRLLKSSVTQSDRDEVSLARTGSCIAVVRIGAQTFKVKY